MPDSFRGKIALVGLLSVFGLFLVFTTVFLCDHHIAKTTSGFHSGDLHDLPGHEVALVLGCAETLSNGRTNRYFTARIDAAALLFRSGKCRFLIVSGDNSRKDYDEPARMTAALVKRGIPEHRIFQDYAGFRTLDSIVRAKQIFGQKELIVVSQAFHNERAIYIARHHGLKMRGMDAADVTFGACLKTQIREKAARVKTIMDLYLLHTEPRFLGPPISVGQVPAAFKNTMWRSEELHPLPIHLTMPDKDAIHSFTSKYRIVAVLPLLSGFFSAATRIAAL